MEYFNSLVQDIDTKRKELKLFNVLQDSRFKFSDLDESFDARYYINTYLDVLILLKTSVDGCEAEQCKHLKESYQKLNEFLYGFQSHIKFSGVSTYNYDNRDQILDNIESDIYRLRLSQLQLSDYITALEFKTKVKQLTNLYK